MSAAALESTETPLIPRRVLFGNPEKASPELSPDGKMLAYLAPDEGVLNVWVRTLGADDDRPVTRDRVRGIRDYVWQPDSTHLIYLQDTGGNENFHLFQTSLETRETRDLTPFEGVRAQVVAIDRLHPEEMLVALNKRDPQLFDVYRLSFASGELTLDTENPGDVSGWTADNALEVRAAEAVTEGGWQEVRIRADRDSPWRMFQRWGPDEAMGGVAAFTPTNDAVYLLTSVGANTARLLEVKLADGASRVVAEDPHYDVGGVLVHPTRRELQAVSFVRARVEWQLLDSSLRDDFDVIGHGRDADFGISSRDVQDRTWIVLYRSDDASPAYYLYDRARRSLSFLFAVQPEIDRYRLAKMQPIRYAARDGLSIEGYLTLPVGAERNLPTVLLVHGGPWARDVWGYSPLVQMLANRGYAVLQPNFRGSTGYGKEFLNAGDREWGARMHDDLLDAKAWAVAQGYADPARVAIMGGSYGGYATLAALAFTPEEFACGVDIVGPSNLLTLLRSIPPYWAPMRAIFDKRVGNIESEEDFLKSRSPLFRAGNIRAPLLIGQGANDPRVKQQESDQIVSEMRHNGLPVEYIVFPDEGHGFARPENSMRFWAATEQFLARYLGGRAEPPSPAEAWSDYLQ